MAQWQCRTHHVTLQVTPGQRSLQGVLGAVGGCILSQAKPEAVYQSLASEHTRRWVHTGRSRMAEQIEEVSTGE